MIIRGAKSDPTEIRDGNKFLYGRGPNRLAYTLEVTFDSQAELKRAIDMTMSGESVRLYHPEFTESLGLPKLPKAPSGSSGYHVVTLAESIRDEIKRKLGD